MANVRITAQMRDELVRAIVKSKYEAMEKEAEARAKALNNRLIEFLLPPEVTKILDAAPAGHYPIQPSLYVAFGGGYDGNMRVQFSEQRRVTYTQLHSTIHIQDKELSDEFHAIRKFRSDMQEDRKKEEAQIRAVITSSGTAQKLRAVWPEITPYIDKICQVTIVPGLPAVILKDLNKKFNLPPTEE